MRHIIAALGVASLAFSTAALADQGRGKGKSQARGGYYEPACPPGLAKKRNGCLPPGQAKKIYGAGQRLPAGYRYAAVPRQYLDQIGGYDPDRYRYYYDDGTVYAVDPTSRLIQEVIRLVLR